MEFVVGVATDDIMHFTTLGPRCGEQWMRTLENTFGEVGVISNSDKDVNGVLDSTCLGIDIIQGIFVGPSAHKMCSFLEAAVDLFHFPECSPLELSSFTGTLQWFDLLNRWSLSCLSDVYAFNRADGQENICSLPAEVVSELMLNIALFPCLEVDLRRPWLDRIVATDASPAYGFGVAVAQCPRSTARLVGKASLNPDTVIRLTRDPDDPLEKLRRGKEVRLTLRQRHFRTVLSVKAKHKDHSGGMEAHVLSLGLRWLARKRECHGTRVPFLVDAKAVLGAAVKGRSSAPTLRHQIRQGSRGLLRRKAVNRHMHVVIRNDGKRVKHRRTKLEIQLEAHHKRMDWLHQWCSKHCIAEASDVSASNSTDESWNIF
jgi:hypothetical protein